jgi:hypothetical protein
VAVIGLFGAAGFAWANSRVAHTRTRQRLSQFGLASPTHD